MLASVVSYFALIICLLHHGIVIVETQYLIGAGIADITGPAADAIMLGFSETSQVVSGIHFRQYSRAFIVAEDAEQTPVVFVSTDSSVISQVVKLEVVKELVVMYGNRYTEKNLCLSGTHTHSGPGGFHQYFLYGVPTLGFLNETFQSLVQGIVLSIQRAHDSMRPGNIFVNEGELLDNNINRSPTAYVNNPGDERARYEHNVDKTMTILKFVDTGGVAIGMISWFAVHCTSMNSTNILISGDNKGYASYLFEKAMNGNSLPGEGTFVAAFAQSNLGDVSPNTAGPHCINTGGSCDAETSTCKGRNDLCVAFGPGEDMFESTRIIGDNQYTKAMELYDAATVMVTGSVDFRHTYVDMTEVEVKLEDTIVKTCKPAMGYSFAAGTTDGHGVLNFRQGMTKPTILWTLIRNKLRKPSKKQILCHLPKPILLDTGEMSVPYQWQPEIVDTQILRIGQLTIIAVPAEFSTMSGRRTREAVTSSLVSGGFAANTISVIAGLANDYASYVTTFEEYQVQRYEGASTIYGPHTLEAFIQTFVMLADSLVEGSTVVSGPTPPNLLSKQFTLISPVKFDLPHWGREFGDVLQDAYTNYTPGMVVEVNFVAANPRNNLKNGGTFLTIEQLQCDQQWTVVYTDGDWDTRFYWTESVLNRSEAKITWEIQANQQEGTYRIQYFGDWKRIDGSITPFSGTSISFVINASGLFTVFGCL